MSDPKQHLEKLIEGNRRFTQGDLRSSREIVLRRLSQSREGQNPDVAVLACSDSRLPIEAIFDSELGELFVARVAGNVVCPAEAATIEFASLAFSVDLVLVLGHSGCGAVSAALEKPRSEWPPALLPVLERIEPAIADARAVVSTNYELAGAVVEANVRRSIGDLRAACPDLAARVQRGEARIVGGVYDLESGLVRFLE